MPRVSVSLRSLLTKCPAICPLARTSEVVTVTLKNYYTRPLTSADQAFLWEMVYQSLYVPPGQIPFERAIVLQPDIAKYVKDWGREDDLGFVADDAQNRSVGAAWLRLFQDPDRGFGYVNDETPEIGIAVLPDYRDQGIGTMLLRRLIESAQSRYEAISLSVAAENPAVRLYQRFGFEVVQRTSETLIMTRKLVG